jgi:ribosomal protein L35AE/L33A
VEIEYQIDLFEIRQDLKFKKRNKQKVKISSYRISRKTLKSEHPLIKIYGINDKKNIRS